MNLDEYKMYVRFSMNMRLIRFNLYWDWNLKFELILDWNSKLLRLLYSETRRRLIRTCLRFTRICLDVGYIKRDRQRLNWLVYCFSEVCKALNKNRGLYGRWSELQNVSISSPTGGIPLSGSATAISRTDELDWTTTELRKALRSIEWDLDDLEDTIYILFQSQALPFAYSRARIWPAWTQARWVWAWLQTCIKFQSTS